MRRLVTNEEKVLQGPGPKIENKLSFGENLKQPKADEVPFDESTAKTINYLA